MIAIKTHTKRQDKEQGTERRCFHFKKTRRLIVVFAVIAALSGCALVYGALNAYADEEEISVGYLTYVINTSEKTATITECDDSENKGFPAGGKVEIPEKIKYKGADYTVTSLQYYSFANCSSLTSIIIPDSVTTIGMHAFTECSSLTNVRLPKNITVLDDFCFSSCSSLTNVAIPNGVASIGYGCFYNSGISSITIPSAVTMLGTNCFGSCFALGEVIFKGDSITRVSLNSFGDLDLNRKFIFEKGIPVAVSVTNGVSSDNSYFRVKFFDDKGKMLKYVDVANPGKDHSAAAVAPEVKCNDQGYVFAGWDSDAYKRVSNTGMSITARYDLSRKANIEQQNGIVYALDSNNHTACAVAYTSALKKDVAIPDSITKNGKTYTVSGMQEMLFNNCTTLETLTIASSIELNAAPLRNCTSLKKVTFKNKPTALTDFFFAGCSSLEDIDLPNSVTSIGKSFVSGCTNLKTVKSLGKAGSLRERMFAGCQKLERVNLPDSIISLDDYTFSYCSSLKNITLPNTLWLLGNSCFENCKSLTDITIPKPVGLLGDSCFKNCASLKNISIPSSVGSFGSDCFSECSSLRNISIPNSVTALPDRCFHGCRSLANITISNNITSLGEYCFENCTFKNVTVPNSVTALGTGCFRQCAYLESINLPDNLTLLPDLSFDNCESLANISIPSKVTHLGRFCFCGCTSLKSIKLPAGVTLLNECCFVRCSNLAEVIFEGANITACSSNVFDDGPDDRKYVFEKTIPAALNNVKAITDINSYFRVKFVDDTGALLKQQDVLKANTPYTKVSEPYVVELSAITGCDFKGWSSNDYKTITNSGMVITALYNGGLVNISSSKISASIAPQVYSGMLINPSASEITITYKKDAKSQAIKLVEGVSYKIVEYGKNSDAGLGAGSVKVAGIGSFNGERIIKFDIGKDISNVVISDVAESYGATGFPINPEPVVADVSVKPAAVLVKDRDYTLNYQNCTNVGIATIIVTGKGNYAGKKEFSFTITAPSSTSWKRLSGGTVLSTMKKIVDEGWSRSEYAVIATSKGYQDALSATALAGILQCPVLMSDPQNLSAQTSALLKAKKVKKVVIVGGTSALSTTVEAQIKSLGATVERLAGGTATATARQVYNYGKNINGGWGKDAIVATVKGYQDVLSIAPYAYAKKAPIFLADPSAAMLNTACAQAIVCGGFTRTIIVGGTNAVKQSVEAQVVNPLRLAGGTAYGTCKKIANFCLANGMTAQHIGVTTAKNYQDALCGAALCGKNNSILLFADDKNHNNVSSVIAENKLALCKNCYIFGGESAISKTIEHIIESASQ